MFSRNMFLVTFTMVFKLLFIMFIIKLYARIIIYKL